jgi:cbb3-type cytochrome oxidase subunit 1
VLPRLFGHALHSTRLAVVHLFCANVGLAGLVLGFLLRPHSAFDARWLTATGGSLFALGAMLWVYNLWRTFDAADARQRARANSGHRQLPRLDE